MGSRAIPHLAGLSIKTPGAISLDRLQGAQLAPLLAFIPLAVKRAIFLSTQVGITVRIAPQAFVPDGPSDGGTFGGNIPQLFGFSLRKVLSLHFYLPGRRLA